MVQAPRSGIGTTGKTLRGCGQDTRKRSLWLSACYFSGLRIETWGTHFLLSESRLVRDHVDGDGDGLGRVAGSLVAGLVAKACLHEVIPMLGRQVRLNREFAGVDAEFGVGIQWQGKVLPLRIRR